MDISLIYNSLYSIKGMVKQSLSRFPRASSILSANN